MKTFYAILLMLFISTESPAQELDLNPAVFGCIAGGGSCLTNTGIRIVDEVFSLFVGGYNVDESRYQTYDYKKKEYEDPQWWHQYGNEWCRNIKEEAYLKKIGWKAPPTGCDTCDRKNKLDWHKYNTRNDKIFDCTDAQKKIYAKARLIRQFGKE